MIELGNRVKDRVTGFTGIATARVEYLNGCVQFCVRPSLDKDGKYPDGQYIDNGQLEIVDEGIAIAKRAAGGDMSNTPRATYGS